VSYLFSIDDKIGYIGYNKNKKVDTMINVDVEKIDDENKKILKMIDDDYFIQ
jgi:hypothetical protein